MTSKHLPSVLLSPRGSISLERALKQMKQIIESIDPVSDGEVDRINASLDDIETMLKAIER